MKQETEHKSKAQGRINDKGTLRGSKRGKRRLNEELRNGERKEAT